MPLNELEYHPYLNYYHAHPASASYSALIVGSFPIYAITQSQPVEDLGNEKRNNWNMEASMQFFYGSRKNRLWDRLKLALTGEPMEENELNPQYAADLLGQYDFRITDVIENGYRNGYSASDSALVPINYNRDLLTLLSEMEGTDVFFTALPNRHSPFYHFGLYLQLQEMVLNEVFAPVLGSRNLSFNFENRIFNIGFLFSPSGQAAINGANVPEFMNYLQLNPGAVYSDFVKEQWRQLLHYRNFAYNGTNPAE